MFIVNLIESGVTWKMGLWMCQWGIRSTVFIDVERPILIMVRPIP